MKIFTKKWSGFSSDGRTNRWQISCKCGKLFVPTTTMLSKREETCPKCGKSEVVYYMDDEKTPLTKNSND